LQLNNTIQIHFKKDTVYQQPPRSIKSITFCTGEVALLTWQRYAVSSMQTNKSSGRITIGLLSLAVSTIVILSGCLSFFQQNPKTSEEDDYITRIGTSKTTTIDAVLNISGEYSIEYTYIDSHWLLARGITIETDCCIRHFDSSEAVKVENEKGDVLETDRITIPRNLFEQILESENPIISIRGKQGNIIIEMGSESMKNLKEFLNYGKKRFPE